MRKIDKFLLRLKGGEPEPLNVYIAYSKAEADKIQAEHGNDENSLIIVMDYGDDLEDGEEDEPKEN